jgi:hypothetical protein
MSEIDIDVPLRLSDIDEIDAKDTDINEWIRGAVRRRLNSGGEQ